MSKFHKTDIIVNVLLPLLLGLCIYFLSSHFGMFTIARNHLPDALWAWSLISCLLIIWERRISTLWIATAFALSIFFEVLQHYHLIKGVGDVTDVFFYILAVSTALFLNNYFFIFFNYHYD